MEAAASIVGIVSFGLGLAKTLQAFVDSVIEAEETIILIVAEVNATASTLKRLQDFIEQDKAASDQQHRTTIFNDTGLKEIGACALQCQKIYVQIIVLIEKASMPNGEEGSKDTNPPAPAADDPNGPAVRLAVFSKNVTKLGRKMKWPWLEPRIKRCQEHLGRLKVSLLLSLQVFFIAESRSRPFVATVLGTDDENEMRDRAETLRKKITELRAKKSPQRPPNRPPPGPDYGVREVPDSISSSSDASITSGNRSSSGRVIMDYSSSASSSYLGSDGVHRPRRSRTYRAVRALRTFKAHVRKMVERKAVFKRDCTSTVFEAYLIHSFPGPFFGPFSGNPAVPPPIKLPFGHRRLNRQVKRALRKCNPWDILLILSPTDRGLVDLVVQQAQLAASSNMSVILVAIEVDGYSDANLAGLETDYLTWSRMVLFFRHEPLYIEEGAPEHDQYVIGGRPRFTATVRNMFRSSQRRNTKHKELQAKLKRDKDERDMQEARNRADRENIEKEKAEMEDDKKALEAASNRIEEEKEKLEAEKTRIAEEKDAMQSKDRALKNAEQAVLKSIERGTAEEELKRVFEEERAKKMVEEEHVKKMMREELAHRRLQEEHAKKLAIEKAAAEKAAAEKAKPPVKFKDAVGRKFNFPFHLVQTWQGMEDMIKQAFLHVESIGPHVLEGRYDLADSEEQVILPSTWAETIKPGAFVTMRMWPMKTPPPPPPAVPTHSFGGRPMPGIPPTPYPGRPAPSFGGRPMPGIPPTPYPGMPGVSPDAAYLAAPRPGFRPLFPPGYPPPPPRRAARRPALVKVKGRGTPRKPRAKSSKFLFRGRAEKKSAKVSNRVDVEDISSGEMSEDIDKELGLDDLEIPEQMASKDIDELLAAWTNPSSDGNQE